MASLLPEVNPTVALRPFASNDRRFVGQIIDWLITLAIFLLVVPFAWFGDTIARAPFYLGLAYYLLCDGLPGGQSLAKRWLGMAVINSDTGKPCTYWQSALRNISQGLGILDWIWIFGSNQRRAGDILAHTVVVKT